jgi:Protein of unknown function (DUF4242)
MENEMLKKYIIERNVPTIGSFDHTKMMGVAKTSNQALAQLGGKVEWVESFVTADMTYCVYLAENEDAIRKHAELSGFPANVISQVETMISPITERA